MQVHPNENETAEMDQGKRNLDAGIRTRNLQFSDGDCSHAADLAVLRLLTRGHLLLKAASTQQLLNHQYEVLF